MLDPLRIDTLLLRFGGVLLDTCLAFCGLEVNVDSAIGTTAMVVPGTTEELDVGQRDSFEDVSMGTESVGPPSG